MTLSASRPFLASTRWRAIVRATSGDYLGQCGIRLRSLWNVIRCKNKTSREFLRKPSQNVFGNAYNSATNASENFLVFAGTPASLAANARAFAGVPQERYAPFWRLQDCCKHFQRHFGRYNMLSETFSMNKGISFFCRTHVMDSIGTLA